MLIADDCVVVAVVVAVSAASDFEQLQQLTESLYCFSVLRWR